MCIRDSSDGVNEISLLPRLSQIEVKESGQLYSLTELSQHYRLDVVGLGLQPVGVYKKMGSRNRKKCVKEIKVFHLDDIPQSALCPVSYTHLELSDVLFNLNELGDEYLQPLTFLGRLGGHDLYLTVPYTLDHQAILYQTSASRLDVIKEVMLGMSVFKVKILDNQLYVITEEMCIRDRISSGV